MDVDAEQLLRWRMEAEAESAREHRHPRKIFRKGKTERDHRRGSHARHLENKLTRTLYYQMPSTGFPWNTCNGKRNRQVWTGRNNTKEIHPMRFA